MRILIVSSCLAAAATAACATARTRAATAPSVGAFDPSRSDPHALAVADAAIAAVGGYDNWAHLEELDFEVQYRIAGKREGWFRHHWDRWNGRHRFQAADGVSLDKDADHADWLDVRYDLFDDNRLPLALYEGVELDEPNAHKYAELAHQRLDEDAALFSLVHRLRDPGVHLGDGGAVTGIAGADDLCKPSCTAIEVTFDKGAGDGTWVLDINDATHRPQVVAKQIPAGRVAYRIDGWTAVGGLEWPTRLTNVAIASEVFSYSGVTVGVPEDAVFAMPVERPDGAPVERHVGKFDPQTFGVGATPPPLKPGMLP